MAILIDGLNGGKIQIYEKGESGNPNGRPKRGVSKTIKDLSELGIEWVKARDVSEIYEKLMNCTREELREIIENPEQSIITIITAKGLLDERQGFFIVREMLDRVHGKAVQKVETQVSWSVGLFKAMSTEDLMKQLQGESHEEPSIIQENTVITMDETETTDLNRA